MTDNKPVGGRGKKADYRTKLVRVPIPVLPEVEKAIADFRSGQITEQATENQLMDLDQALEAARKILKSKKSASESIKKLLQVLYSCQIDKL